VEDPAAVRLVVFVDTQNVYRDARRAFFNTVPPAPPAPSAKGQTDALKYGELLRSRVEGHIGRTVALEQIRMYCGKPDAAREPISAAAMERQVAAWESAGAVVCQRPLRYAPDWPATKAQQKGVDVQLSTDLVQLHLRGLYDTAVVASTDTDMRPALESVLEIAGNREYPVVFACAWISPTQKSRMWLPGRPLYCFNLGRADYDAVEDPTRYGPPKVATLP
jgi:uncharacterized LabA/DUF88 family protein